MAEASSLEASRLRARNGVDDSLPSGSGNVGVQLGRQRLPLAHLLQPFQPVQDPIDLTAHA